MHKIDKTKTKQKDHISTVTVPLEGEKKIPLKKVKVHFLSLFFPQNQI